MDEFTRKIIDGSKTALKMAETLVTTPMLINTDLKQGAKYAIPLMCETNQKSASAEVSDSLVISTDAKKYVTDNVAPGSRSWSITGYIPGIKELEPTNKFQPFVRLHTDILWNWFSNGAILVFKDGDAHFYKQVVIKDLKTSQQKDVANATPFSITLKEINTLQMGVIGTDPESSLSPDKQKSSIPEQGSAIGQPAEMGGVSTQKIKEELKKVF